MEGQIAQPVEFSYAIMAKKGVVFAVNYAAGISAAAYGLNFTLGQREVIVGLICSGLAMLRNAVKTKWPDKFNWL